MITVANRIFVAPDYAEAFEERFRSRARLVDGMPGFISNQVLRPTQTAFLKALRSSAYQPA